MAYLSHFATFPVNGNKKMLMNMDPKARDENGQWKGRQKWMLSKLQEEGIRIPCNRENSAFTQSGRSELFNRDQIIVDFNFILNPVQPQNSQPFDHDRTAQTTPTAWMRDSQLQEIWIEEEAIDSLFFDQKPLSL